VLVRLYDAHNHLQDERFAGRQAELIRACQQEGVVRMVVNGSCEEDWPAVLALARSYPLVLPSFGYHPWCVHQRSPAWLQALTEVLDQLPAGVGEIGLDRWKPGLAYADQEEVFVAQLRLAAERNLPVSIHCLQAWGRLLELLRDNPRPARGFLLHSYGGSAELVEPLAKLGAYFGLPGYFAHAHRSRKRDVFTRVPRDRLLIETDAPDQPLPTPQTAQPELRALFETGRTYPLTHPANGQPINHPANLRVVYEWAAAWLDEPLPKLAEQLEQNFLRLFGGL
jgi:TatD DNase family protein